MRRKMFVLGTAVMLSLASPASAALAHGRADVAQVAAAAPSASAAAVPEDRGTAFQATTGGTELRDGGKLMVAAYAILWVIVAAYLGLMWSWQRKLQGRIEGLETAIDRAASKKA